MEKHRHILRNQAEYSLGRSRRLRQYFSREQCGDTRERGQWPARELQRSSQYPGRPDIQVPAVRAREIAIPSPHERSDVRRQFLYTQHLPPCLFQGEDTLRPRNPPRTRHNYSREVAVAWPPTDPTPNHP